MTDVELALQIARENAAAVELGGYMKGAVSDAHRFVSTHFTHAEGVTLRRWRGGWYLWDPSASCYEDLTLDQIDALIYRGLGVARSSEVAEVRSALRAVSDVLIDHVDLGGWIGPAPTISALDQTIDLSEPRDVAACRNALVHLPTGATVAPTPRYFTTSTLGVDYRVIVPAPVRWLEFLRTLWPDDEESIATLQEWFGYLLTPDTDQQKILLLVGPKRSGKGTIMRVLQHLLGPGATAAPTLSSLGTNFGLWPLIGKSAAIIGDARLGGRSDTPAIMERLLSISGQDPQTIDRKNLAPWTGFLSARFTVVTNELPRFADASGALASRFLVLQTSRSWYGQEDTGLTRALLAELPGILNWAIDGWRRLRDRGGFVQPTASAEVVNELADLASPVAAWARAHCVERPGARMLCQAAYSAFQTYCREQGIERAPTQAMFGRDLKSATGCDRRQVRDDAGRRWYYEGIELAVTVSPAVTG